MSHNTPGIKVAAVKDIGAKVILEGDNYDAAAQYAKKLSENLGLPLIRPTMIQILSRVGNGWSGDN